MLNKSLLMLLVVVGLVNADPYQPYGGSYSGATRYTRRQSYGNRGYYNYRNSGRYNSGTYDGPRVYTSEHLNPIHQNHHNPIHQNINNHHNPAHHNPTHHTIDILSPIHFNNGQTPQGNPGFDLRTQSQNYDPAHYPNIVAGYPFYDTKSAGVDAHPACPGWCYSDHNKDYYCCNKH